MGIMPNVVIGMARCAKNRQSFGIRLEKINKGFWEANWAFIMQEKMAKKEGYEKDQIVGFFAFIEEYPGSPHCKANAAVVCECGKVACWDGEMRRVICPWCGKNRRNSR